VGEGDPPVSNEEKAVPAERVADGVVVEEACS
jgi:hypothetical protein